MPIFYKESVIQYHTFGSGSKLLLCLHGYGLNGHSFEFLEDVLGKEFTLIAIDFPFHGATKWNEHASFSSNEIIELLKFITRFNEKEKFSILGYSMGGRVGLQLLEDYSNLIEQIILIAPDGLHKNKWQWFATQTKLGNRLFKFTMKHPRWLFVLVQIADNLRLLNKSIVKFVHFYIDNEDERMQLFYRWTTMRLFKPNLKKLQQIIYTKHIPVKMLFGKLDRIIISKKGYTFQKNMPSVLVKEINAGHQLLQPKYAAEIKALFNK